MKCCTWANVSSSEEKYHGEEWGVPLHDDRLLFEFMILEGAQAGLNWSTILSKLSGYRKAFNNFNAQKVARYSANKIEKLLLNPDIVRNKLKVNAAVKNARAFLEIQHEFESFECYIWKFVNNKLIQNS